MRRAYFVVAYGLVILATAMLIALVVGGPREPIADGGWRDLERVDSV